MTEFPIDWCRAQFPALRRTCGDASSAYFDGPGGSQVPHRVIDAVSHYLAYTNANRGGHYATARESDELIEAAHAVVADFVGSPSAESIVFGANMTTLTFAASRAISRTWKPGDEVIVTKLDHDGNVTPWVLAARDVGATVRYVNFRHSDCTLDLEDFQSKLSDRTRMVAVGCASNIVGTINPVAEICRRAHAVGAQVFLDAVHYAPHALPCVHEWDCDWMACSAYKFFGPHVGVLYGRPELLKSIVPYKLRPVTETIPGRWMTGTQNFEGIAGTKAAIEYLIELGQRVSALSDSNRTCLQAAYSAIGAYERQLLEQLMAGLNALSDRIQILGIKDAARFPQRTPTVSFVHKTHHAADVAMRLSDAGLFIGHGNFYALQVTESLGLEPDGVVRIGLMHYNTAAEIERLLSTLDEL